MKTSLVLIVDPDQQTLEIYLLDVDGYPLIATLQGENPLSAPPFTDLKFAAKEIFV
jgi:hypothetical protein